MAVCVVLTLFDASAAFDPHPPATCFHSPWSLSLSHTFCSWLSSLLLPAPICGCSPRFYLQTFPLNDLSAWPGLSRCLLVLCGLALPSSPRCISNSHLDPSSLFKGDLKVTIFPPWLSVFPIFFFKFTYLFIYGCAGSSFLCEGFLQLWQAGATLHRGARASHSRNLSCCGAQAPDAQAQ